MNADTEAVWLDEGHITASLDAHKVEDAALVAETLAKAEELHGLNADDAAALLAVKDPELREQIFHAAARVKERIYGRRVVLFAPLYFSSLCGNECLYCAFRSRNTEVLRRALSMQEIDAETRILLRQGHKRLLLVAGEAYPGSGIDYVLDTIDTVYAAREDGASIRRVNVNLAPLSVEDFRRLGERHIGTFQLFQETYHRPTYARVHLAGPKRNFDWRASCFDRAMLAGIDDVGMGLLYGLYDWRFETLALLSHIGHLEERFGVGCHTISVPRMEPAAGSEMAMCPPHPLGDDDFLLLIAVLRLAVPYTGIILSTRENASLRQQALELGVSQISAGSRTSPGGYAETADEDSDNTDFDAAQFRRGDCRNLEEVVADLAERGYIPSFCTGCYRKGRTGKDFMDLARPGLISRKCTPNALSTFEEYLLDYASPATRALGESAIARCLEDMDDKVRKTSERLLHDVRAGQRDVYC